MALFWSYVLVQVVSCIFALITLKDVKNKKAVKTYIRNHGKSKNNKHSMYKFSDFTYYFLMGLIPLYFTYFSINLMFLKEELEDEEFDKKADNDFWDDSYKDGYSKEELEQERIYEEMAKDSIAYDEKAAMYYENDEKYHAKKNELNNIYDEYETPIEYITKEIEKNKNEDTSLVIKETKEEKDEEVSELTQEELAEALSDLSEKELANLIEKLKMMLDIKKKHDLFY